MTINPCRVQRDVTPAGFRGGRIWHTVAARGRRAVAERLALNLRVDGRKAARADLRPSYRIAPAAR